MENDAKQKLKSKLRKKKQERSGNPLNEFNSETDIVKMMESVNNLLRTNPQMVQQVSKCVSNVIGNKDLMDTLMNQFQDQTLDNNKEGASEDASENE